MWLRKATVLAALGAAMAGGQKGPSPQSAGEQRQAADASRDTQSEVGVSGKDQMIVYRIRLGAAEFDAVLTASNRGDRSSRLTMASLDRAGNVLGQYQGDLRGNEPARFGPAEANWSAADVVVVKTTRRVELFLQRAPGAATIRLAAGHDAAFYEIASADRLEEIATGEGRKLEKLDAAEAGPASPKGGVRAALHDPGIYMSRRAK